MGIDSLRAYRKSFNSESRKQSSNSDVKNVQFQRQNPRELPILVTSKVKAMVSISSLGNDIKIYRKGKSMKDPTIFYYPM